LKKVQTIKAMGENVMQHFRIHFCDLVTWGRRPDIHLFLFCGFLIFLCWPVLTIAESTEPCWSVVVYLFGLWAIMIAVIFFIAMSCLKSTADDPKAQKDPTSECEIP
jgi:hypothetical protein